jgi:hypothetical protein
MPATPAFTVRTTYGPDISALTGAALFKATEPDQVSFIVPSTGVASFANTVLNPTVEGVHLSVAALDGSPASVSLPSPAEAATLIGRMPDVSRSYYLPASSGGGLSHMVRDAQIDVAAKDGAGAARLQALLASTYVGTQVNVFGPAANGHGTMTAAGPYG